jgi:hypothetical protein
MSDHKPVEKLPGKKPPVSVQPPVRTAADGGLAPSNRLMDQQEHRSSSTGRYLPVPHTHPDPAKDPVAQAAAFAAAYGEPWTEHDSRTHDVRRQMFDTLHGSQDTDAEASEDA